ncbi:hypothetical protein QUA27_23965 [Microcoleus sp. Pol14C6]|uniref:hypothetical protein n=1 Tax=unclassified Microcoleus TaxID=2642155 RepID=UPI002FD5BB5C
MNCRNSQEGRLFHRGGWGEELQINRPESELFRSYEEVSRSLEKAEDPAEQERLHAAVLAERLRAMGIDPEQL